MATTIPYSGEHDGYKYELLTKTAVDTQYLLTSPSGTKVMVKCYSQNECRQLSTNPSKFWKEHVGYLK